MESQRKWDMVIERGERSHHELERMQPWVVPAHLSDLKPRQIRKNKRDESNIFDSQQCLCAAMISARYTCANANTTAPHFRRRVSGGRRIFYLEAQRRPQLLQPGKRKHVCWVLPLPSFSAPCLLLQCWRILPFVWSFHGWGTASRDIKERRVVGQTCDVS